VRTAVVAAASRLGTTTAAGGGGGGGGVSGVTGISASTSVGMPATATGIAMAGFSRRLRAHNGRRRRSLARPPRFHIRRLGSSLTSSLPAPYFLEELIDAAGVGLRPFSARLAGAFLPPVRPAFRLFGAANDARQDGDDNDDHWN